MLHIRRNTMKKISEYIIEVMEQYKRPMTLEEICAALRTMDIRVPQNIESLRSSILSIDEVTAIGKTSTYALKKWDNVKTGTIKQLVYNYLKQFDDPVHISRISDFVNQYRKTNNKNILSNLKLDKTDSFIFFRKGYVGLSEKDYEKTSTIYSKLKAL
jgi:predicted Zn-ribbon and HTH transcriptional regulator